jgi:glycoprotein endo-alpha-1,2-mannosidase
LWENINKDGSTPVRPASSHRVFVAGSSLARRAELETERAISMMPRFRWALVLVTAGVALAASDSCAATVGAYYYPWYGPGAGGHHYNDVMRMHLTPSAQPPALGTYSSRDASAIATHIDQSHRGNISMWSMSWWGPNSYEDVTIRNNILPHPRASELSYTIHYETSGRLGSSIAPNYARFQTDMRYLGQNIFNNPNYMRIDNRPVVVLYLSRDYFRNQAGWDALASMRTMMQTEFGYDPYVIGDHFFGDLAPGAANLDGVTAFDIYGQAFGTRPTDLTRINRLEDIYDFVQRAVDTVGTDFIPGVTPGYNDTAVRDGNAPSPRYLTSSGYGPSTQGSTMREMLDRAVLPHLDDDVNDLILVNSFNEWHEDTQIEPTVVAPATNTDNTPTGHDFTSGYYYEGYGDLYLDILREKTLADIPGDFNRDGRVDAADLAGPDGWQERFGSELDGSDFLAWQRNLGYVNWPTAGDSSSVVPEPAAMQLVVGAAIALALCVLSRRVSCEAP